MRNRLLQKVVLLFVLSLALLVTAFPAFADGVKYLYDDLGQLKKVVDENGNVATYN